VTGFIHPLLQGSDQLTHGYSIATEHEFGTMRHAASQDPELVERWQNLLTLYREALQGTWTFPGNPTDEEGRIAFELKIKLLGLAASTSKFTLDAALFGYYSASFGMIRHMLECWYWSVHVGYCPKDARAWYSQSIENVSDDQQRVQRDTEKIIRSVIKRFKKDYPNKSYVVEQTEKVRIAMHKGAHATGHLLTQMESDDEKLFIFGANYRPKFTIFALSCGIWATLLALSQLNDLRPQGLEWQLTLAEIMEVHQVVIPGYTD